MADRLNVLVVTPRYPPLVGGAATYTEMLARYLAGRHDVARVGVIAPFAPGAKVVERDGTLEIYRILLPRGGRPLTRAAVRVLSDAIMLVAILVLTLTRRFHVLHVHGSLSRFGAVVANWPLETLVRALRLRGVLDLRDPIVTPRRSSAWSQTICASRAILERALAVGIAPDDCNYLPPPIDLVRVVAIGRRAQELPRAHPYGQQYICYVGEITAWKGIRELLDGFRLVSRNGGALTLLLVGPIVPRSAQDGEWPRLLRSDPDVHWIGPRMWEDAIAIIANASLVVVPSHVDREGIPRVCLEAVALGRRVLLPAGVREFEDSDPDWVLRDTSPGGLARAIEFALRRSDIPRYDLAPHEPDRVFSRYLALYR